MLQSIQKIFGRGTGKPIVIVSGLPRSGTSMMMKMLDAAGIPIMTDAIRTADVDNPKGYFEFERVAVTSTRCWQARTRCSRTAVRRTRPTTT